MTATELIIQSMQSNRGLLLAMLEDLDDRALVYRPAGGRGNHALWLLGHVANSESHLVGWAGGQCTVPPLSGAEKFGMGSTPVADLAAYPGKQQVLDFAAVVRKQVLDFIAKVGPADLDKPAVNAPPFFTTRGQCLGLLVTHEMMHIGQLTVVRKELAKPPVIG